MRHPTPAFLRRLLGGGALFLAGVALAWSATPRFLFLDPALLATRADVEALVRGDDDARLATGWRAAVAGGPIRRLVSGDAALAFENGAVILEERSKRPVV